MPPPKCNVEHCGRVVQLSYSEDAFSFKDFDYYTRRKFKLMDSTVIRYCTEAEDWKDDVLPTAQLLKEVGTLRVAIDSDNGNGQYTGGQTHISSQLTPVTVSRKVFTPSSSTAAVSLVGTTSRDDLDSRKKHNNKTPVSGHDDENIGNCPSTEDKRAEPFTPVVTTSQSDISRGGAGAGARNKYTRSLVYGYTSELDLHVLSAYIPYIAVALLSTVLAPRWATNHSMWYIFEYLEVFAVKFLGLPSSGISHTQWRTLFIEAWVTFVCRLATELYIRRALNPENDVRNVLKKFSLDAVFAGISAGSFVLLRKLAISNLK